MRPRRIVRHHRQRRELRRNTSASCRYRRHVTGSCTDLASRPNNCPRRPTPEQLRCSRKRVMVAGYVDGPRPQRRLRRDAFDRPTFRFGTEHHSSLRRCLPAQPFIVSCGSAEDGWLRFPPGASPIPRISGLVPFPALPGASQESFAHPWTAIESDRRISDIERQQREARARSGGFCHGIRSRSVPARCSTTHTSAGSFT